MRQFIRLSFCSAALVSLSLFGQSALNQTPTRVLGQLQVPLRGVTPNLVEGREFYFPNAVAVDTASSPAPLYVADTANNRVLGFRSSTGFANGAAADIVIGQVDRFTSSANGPSTGRSTGLNRPSGIAVDSRGNLYVADAGNNRILRFPRPFATDEEIRTPDMVLGQRNFSSDQVNQGEGVSATGLAFNSSGGTARVGLAFDGDGNLWTSDPFNNRVLRYPAAAIAGGANGAAANLVLGQIGFNANTAPDANTAGVLDKTKFRLPAGIAFDAGGRLYVAEGLGRVLVFVPPFLSGQSAARILGIPPAVPQGQSPPRVSEYTFGSPEGVVIVNNAPIVVDAGFNRLLRFDPLEQWPVETANALSPPARAVIGQESFTDNRANRGRADSGPDTLFNPVHAVFVNNELFVADASNNRVLVFPNANTGATAVRELGQDSFLFNAPNRLEGKEFFLYNGFSSFQGGSFVDAGGVAIDRSGAAPGLYISDTYNNRILGYRDARRVRTGDPADIVIGQNDFQRALTNAPQNDANVTTETGLFRPTGLAVDAEGNLWVADTGNARVLRFPKPFVNYSAGERLRATIVIGQTSFSSKVQDPTARNMSAPFGLALTFAGNLLVSDAALHRVLLFRRPAGGDFTTGQAAARVFGQPDFVTGARGTGDRRLFSPRHIAVDSDDRLYVADPGNNRVVIYDRAVDPAGANDPVPAIQLTTGVGSPHAVWVSQQTGEVWIGDPRAGQAFRFPRFERLATNPSADFTVASASPLALTQDNSGNLYVAEGVNRVSIFFNALVTTNAANYSTRPLAPGLIASIFPTADNVLFSDSTVAATQVPLPRTLADVQVLIDNNPAPLYFVSARQINFYVPMNSPTSGTGEFQVIRVSTGQVLAAGTVSFAPVSPGLFIRGASDNGQIAALNEDNTVNDPTNPIPRGRVIQLFGTGQGFIPNAPADGAAPTGPVETAGKPDVIIGSGFVSPENILYSGLAPGLVGVWQINVRIPNEVAPDNQVRVAVQLQSVPSNRGAGNRTLVTTIAVRQ